MIGGSSCKVPFGLPDLNKFHSYVNPLKFSRLRTFIRRE
ncbi:hypothetical protein J469_1152 [Acinetobacter baumannii 1046051]|nr:hypothetical protein J453_2635 [Acinetobacter baumannii 1036938]EXC81167.1 hypothetical protein J469_1152 [Acinetobacter baumannii 1046051]EXD08043.1 hypothetical protein J496_0170 [Acinetobacter baumannii 1247182]EXD44615.1 hypothetical protein J476_1967 [Acinetobacter baumannii 532413]EXD66490.1 hypothetical protein J478_2824 [Acinetobacter baumannii 58452]KCW28413.1 hypothetical protein J474_3897 [Acinetobacter baumannii 6935]